MRFLTVLLLLGLAAGLVWQQQRVQSLTRLMAEQRVRMDSLEVEVQKKRDVADLFFKLIVSNRKDILGLRRSRTLTVTAYSPRARETDSTPHITASNRRVRMGIVAVSRDLFNQGWVFGKKVYIKEQGVFTIDDLMAQDKRNQIDIFMANTDAAQRFGRRTLEAHLIDL